MTYSILYIDVGVLNDPLQQNIEKQVLMRITLFTIGWKDKIGSIIKS